MVRMPSSPSRSRWGGAMPWRVSSSSLHGARPGLAPTCPSRLVVPRHVCAVWRSESVSSASPVGARDGRIDDPVAMMVRMIVPVPRWVVRTMVGRVMVRHACHSCACVSMSRARVP
jgi:hypothetical protein